MVEYSLNQTMRPVPPPQPKGPKVRHILFARSRIFLIGLLIAWVFALHLSAEQVVIRIRLLDGRNGKPITGAQAGISLIENYSLQTRQINPSGDEYLISVPADTTVDLGNVRIGASRWYDFKTCEKSETVRSPFAVSEIMATGVVAPNTCSRKVLADARTGVIVFFIQPLSWADKLKYWANGFRD